MSLAVSPGSQGHICRLQGERTERGLEPDPWLVSLALGGWSGTGLAGCPSYFPGLVSVRHKLRPSRPGTGLGVEWVIGIPSRVLLASAALPGRESKVLSSTHDPVSVLLDPLQIMLSPEARNTVWVSFDGRRRQEIRHGDRCVSLGARARSRCVGWVQALPAAFIPLLKSACAGPIGGRALSLRAAGGDTSLSGSWSPTQVAAYCPMFCCIWGRQITAPHPALPWCPCRLYLSLG